MYRIMSLIWLFGILLCTTAVQGVNVDTTIQENTGGESVVTACAEKISQAELGFTDDFDILKHIAYKESEFIATENTGSKGGLWKCPLEKFQKTQSGAINIAAFLSAVKTKLNIDWINLEYLDLNIPLYSALCARFIIAEGERLAGQAVPYSLTEQGEWWSLYYSEDSNPTVDNFVAKVNEIYKFCSIPTRDVIFLVDASSDEAGFVAEARGVIEGVVQFMGFTKTRYGIASYSHQLNVHAYIREFTSAIDLNTVVSAIEYLGPSRYTGKVMSSTVGVMFESSVTVPQVLVLITSGLSDDSIEDVLQLAQEHRVTSLGVHIDVTVGVDNVEIEAELLNITGNEKSVVTVAVTETDDVKAAFKREIASKICEMPYYSHRDTSGVIFEASVSFSESKYMTLSGAAGTNTLYGKTDSSTVTCYMTTNSRTPNEANYELKWVLTSAETTFSYVASDDNTILSFGFFCDSQNEIGIKITEEPDVELTLNSTTTRPTLTTEYNLGSSLSGGEITGIVVSVLVIVFGVIFAYIYFRCCKRGDGHIKHTPLNNMTSVLIDHPSTSTPSSAASGDMKQSDSELRERLAQAIAFQNIAPLEQCVLEFKDLNLDDTDGDLVRAEVILRNHNCKQGLNQAIASRNMKLLEQKLYHARSVDYGEDLELTNVVAAAEKVLQDLKLNDILLKRLIDAIERENDQLIEEIKDELLNLNNCDKATIDNMLLTYRLKKDLENAIWNRERELITRAIESTIDAGMAKQLKFEITAAKRVLRDLEYLEKVREDVMNLKQSSVSEIRSYGHPPPGVYEVMRAVYLLLSYPPDQLDQWRDLQSLMGQTGKQSLRRLISTLEVRSIPHRNADEAKQLLSRFQKQDIQEISEGLAVFFAYACTVVKEFEKSLTDITYVSRLNTPITADIHGVTPAPPPSAPPGGMNLLNLPNVYLVR